MKAGVLAAAAAFLPAVSGAKVTMNVPYVADGVDCMGFVAYDSAKCTSASKCPAVMVIQDWNGMNEYEMARSCMLADEGYVAFAADIYGVNTPKATNQDWIAASSSHGSNATKYMGKISGAFTKLLTYDFVDATKLAAVGYCFGGTGMVNLAMVGHKGFPGIEFPQGLLGVASFHGGLASGYAAPASSTTRPKLLLHSGGKDDSNENITNLTDALENVSAVYEISRYGPSVVHSFTEWGANSVGQAMYDPWVDDSSWKSTVHFFLELFKDGVKPVAKPNLTAMPAEYTKEDVSYVADGVDCLGYVVYKPSMCTSTKKCPAVMVIQDWNGMNVYEKDRAYLLAQQGYVAFAADIYGVNTPKETQSDWVAASSSHSSNATKYMNKIHGAFTKLLTYDFVDSSKLAAMGYCFGGTGMVNLAMVGHNGFPNVAFPMGLLGVVSFHGGLSSGYAAPVAGTRPRLLLHSGGKDDSNDAISKLTNDLEGVGAKYELTRYGPNVVHSFTDWDANVPGRGMYDDRADYRSWGDTMDFLSKIFFGDGKGTMKPTAAQCNMNPGANAAGTQVVNGAMASSRAQVMALTLSLICSAWTM